MVVARSSSMAGLELHGRDRHYLSRGDGCACVCLAGGKDGGDTVSSAGVDRFTTRDSLLPSLCGRTLSGSLGEAHVACTLPNSDSLSATPSVSGRAPGGLQMQ